MIFKKVFRTLQNIIFLLKKIEDLLKADYVVKTAKQFSYFTTSKNICIHFNLNWGI